MAKTDEELKKDIEALLFASGKRMHVDEISKLCSIRDSDRTKTILLQLQENYEKTDSSLQILNEHPWWKLAVRERHISVVKKVVSEPELSKTLIETLAVIAYKAPVMQSEIIKIRTNKAYEHIKTLEELSYIRTEKKGRSRQISLGEKFFSYFDVEPGKIKDVLGSFGKIEAKITEAPKQKAKLSG